MVDYRRMGNMGQQSLGNTTSISFLHHLRDLWKSPRGTVLRIEALALVAIALSFFLAAFGSCRRWSNSWFIQKGFLAANAVFLSLGTYSIGLMQSSSVRSEMYPIWAVSLSALLCCVDSAATSGLDDQSQVWKMLYQLCLYFGYVLVMSMSTTISSDIGNIAICVLGAVTFIKGFNRSMALVLPSRMRNMIREIRPYHIKTISFGDHNEERDLLVYMQPDDEYKLGDIASVSCEDSELDSVIRSCKDVCLSISLSHLLHRRFIGLISRQQQVVKATTPTTTDQPLVKDFKRAFKVVETELAFLYDVLYTSNPFLHYYEAKSASIWAFASIIGICFVGAVAIIPARRANNSPPAGNILVNTTIVDLIITGVILVSLALLQVLQLVLCWTSNWARVAFACHCFRKSTWQEHIIKQENVSWGMRLRASVVKINWFDKHHRWQKKLGQHSLIESISVQGDCHWGCYCCCKWCIFSCIGFCVPEKLAVGVQKCWGLLGLQYICGVLKEMLRGSNTWAAVDLHADVTAAIGDFVTEKIKCDQIISDYWASSKVENGQAAAGGLQLPDYNPNMHAGLDDDEKCIACILMWHVATCYCELAQQLDDDGFLKMQHNNATDVWEAVNRNHRVATALSKYSAYLVASAPRLLPGRSEDIRRLYSQVSLSAKHVMFRTLYCPERRMSEDETRSYKLRTMDEMGSGYGYDDVTVENSSSALIGEFIFVSGVMLGKRLRSKAAADGWKVLAEFWVKALVYMAPSDNAAEEHMQHLSQGGELITHLWALLYHAGIHRWQLPPQQPVKMGWDYIFRVQSCKNQPRQAGPAIVQYTAVEGGDAAEVTIGAPCYKSLDGVSSSQPPQPPPPFA